VPTVEETDGRVGVGTVVNGSVLGPDNAASFTTFGAPDDRSSPARFAAEASAAAVASAAAFANCFSAILGSFAACFSFLPHRLTGGVQYVIFMCHMGKKKEKNEKHEKNEKRYRRPLWAKKGKNRCIKLWFFCGFYVDRA
jgi:hypothetical protein